MKSKILLVLLCAIVFEFTTISVSATTGYKNEEVNVESQVLDITDNPNYVVEKGQISLENIELTVDENNKLLAKPKVDTYNLDMDLLQNELLESIEFEEMLIDALNSDRNITDIGYSEALVKKNEFNELVPVTRSEYNRAIVIGGTENWGKLKLYTFVDTAVSNGERYTVAYSDATWTGIDNTSFSPAVGEDFISITLPSRYIILTNSFWGTYRYSTGTTTQGTVNGRVTNNDERVLVYAFEEFIKPQASGATIIPAKFANNVRIGARAKTKDLNPATNKFVTKYAHTYSNIKLSPSISSAGVVNFGITNQDKAWELSSAVITEF